MPATALDRPHHATPVAPSRAKPAPSARRASSAELEDIKSMTTSLRKFKQLLAHKAVVQKMRIDSSARRNLVVELQSVMKAVAEAANTQGMDAAAAPATTDLLVIDTTENMIQKGHLVPVDQFQTLMGWASKQAVSKALKDRRVFAMSLGTKRYFPAFFANEAYERRHLEAVSKQLGDLPGGAKMQFFASRKGSLGGKTALEALAAGQVDKVLRGAAAYAEA